MAKKESKVESWKVNGRCLDKTSPDEYKDRLISIPQQISNLSMNPGAIRSAAANPDLKDQTFGRPIDGKLAARLISHALSQTKPFLDEYELKSNLEKTQTETTIYQALNLSYGITFDKSIALQILSQPNCEGLRFYLCSRKQKDTGELHTSLVMVGVDINGYDLNFDPIDVKSNNKLTTDTVPTSSLIGEYGYPPGGKTTVDDKIMDEHYVLLNYARKIS